eukprot:COSAG06_NODE_64666_length_259_cov_0.525000_1_plen_65_part_01
MTRALHAINLTPDDPSVKGVLDVVATSRVSIPEINGGAGGEIEIKSAAVVRGSDVVDTDCSYACD